MKHIYAVGDVTATSAFTHSANAQGRRVVQRIAFPWLPVRDAEPLFPGVVLSDPEVATVGRSPQQIAQRYHSRAYPSSTRIRRLRAAFSKWRTHSCATRSPICTVKCLPACAIARRSRRSPSEAHLRMQSRIDRKRRQSTRRRRSDRWRTRGCDGFRENSPVSSGVARAGGLCSRRLRLQVGVQAADSRRAR